MLEFLNSNDTKYNVSIQYDKQNGLAQLVRIELQENERQKKNSLLQLKVDKLFFILQESSPNFL